jgi:hypothetical protein
VENGYLEERVEDVSVMLKGLMGKLDSWCD